MANEWQNNLDDFFQKSQKKKQQVKTSELQKFIADVVLPAFETLRQQLARHDRSVVIRDYDTSAVIIVHHNGEEEMMYRIHGRTYPNGIVPYAEIRFRERKGLRFISTETMFRSGTPDYSVADVKQDEVIRNFVENYTSRVEPD